ncbi:MAG: hypothetical protein M0Z96_00020 [Actinomycetota bacterium]|nr:hypothetical protein [Actinomycetota bacterium]
MTDITLRVLLRFYPRAWRARYGDELTCLILQSSARRSPSLRFLTNVAIAGLRERLRAMGLLGNDLTPWDRVQSGIVLVMWSWMLFVLGGIGVAKAAEYWKAAVPVASARLPEVAFTSLIVAAVIGAVLVVAGVALCGRTFAMLLRTGGWHQVRRPIYRASAISGLTAISLLGVSIWAHHLTFAQRNGHDLAYGVALLSWVVLFSGCLFSWAAAATSIVRHLNLKPHLLTLETRIVVAVAATMAATTVASSVWWVSIAHSAPWFFAGTAPGTAGIVALINLVVPVVFMLTATLLASVGARRSLRNAPFMA